MECVKLCRRCSENIIKNQTETKYRQILLNVKRIQTKVVNVTGGLALFELCGWTNVSNEMLIFNFDTNSLDELSFLQIIQSLEYIEMKLISEINEQKRKNKRNS
eukprot:UN10118